MSASTPEASPIARRATLIAAFDAVNARSPDGIMVNWSADGVYDNPMVNPGVNLMVNPGVGQAARGTTAVRECMVNLVNSLAAAGHFLVVDRVTVGDTNVIAEWHVEPRDGRKGVHVAEFDEHAKLRHVVVYPRAT